MALLRARTSSTGAAGKVSVVSVMAVSLCFWLKGRRAPENAKTARLPVRGPRSENARQCGGAVERGVRLVVGQEGRQVGRRDCRRRLASAVAVIEVGRSASFAVAGIGAPSP